MKRGFKTNSERHANSLRMELGLSVHDPLYARALARHMKVPVITPNEVQGMSNEHLQELFGKGSSQWSALTIVTSQKTFIIHNSSHSSRRQESNIMHELSHLICNHQPSEIVQIDGFAFPIRTCNTAQEEEADWVCGCLKLPRDGILSAVRSRMSPDQVADQFAASIELVKYRIQITGVSKQVERGRRKWGS